ncbi:MAG: hypothetical protein IJF25_06535 [Oscillospiraceae bacterium]|nr:hypothetical protein [Oscillospiraceae bacterium]MBQ4538143.1 hypothetical protein [Oscillospiraceae bacterium]
MATGITTYQCPSCTGPLQFVGESGKLECEYCGSNFEVAYIEELYAEKERIAAEAQRKIDELKEKQSDEQQNCWSDEEAAGMKVYNCPSCGAELICDETTAASSCPYCGNPTIVPGQFSGGLKPDLVIPFKLDKQAAVDALKKYYKGKKFLPKAFADNNHIQEIQGVYVPFWLYDCKIDSTASYAARNMRVYRRGNYEITETDHFHIQRKGYIAFEKIPVDASTKMPDEHMDAVEPFDYSELKPFSTAYLPGFLADKYDVDKKQSMPRIEERAKNTAEDELRKTVFGYQSVTNVAGSFITENCDAKYALLPVWMLSTKWNGQNFLFAMNGQTGKLIGDLPVDKGKFFAWLFGIALPITAALFGFLML